MNIKEIDLEFQGKLFAISSFLIESNDGPILVESGPYSTVKSLEEGLQKNGYQSGDIKHVFLSHIHLDHAGAAWHFAEKGATIYLHPLGYKHMHDPSKLLASAKMIYGDLMEQLWGTLKPIAAEKLIVVEDNETIEVGGLNFNAIYSPGHAKHHIAWKVGGVIFAGDVAGVRIKNGPVVPPCPPPDINIENWIDSINKIMAMEDVTSYYLTHGGKITDLHQHMENLKSVLNKYAEFMLPHFKAGSAIQDVVSPFTEFTKQELIKNGATEEQLEVYETANPSYMAVAGLMRYWKKKLG